MMTGESSFAITGRSVGVLYQLSRALLTMISALSDGIVVKNWVISSAVFIVRSGRFIVSRIATATCTKIMHEPAITEEFLRGEIRESKPSDYEYEMIELLTMDMISKKRSPCHQRS